MSDDTLVDWLLESFAPTESSDLERLSLGVEACIRAHGRRQTEDLGEEIE